MEAWEENTELEWMWTEMTVVYFRFYPGIWLEKLRNITKNLSQNSQHLCRDFKSGRSEYDAGVTPTLANSSVISHWIPFLWYTWSFLYKHNEGKQGSGYVIPLIFNSALDGGKLSASRSCRILLGKELQVPTGCALEPVWTLWRGNVLAFSWIRTPHLSAFRLVAIPAAISQLPVILDIFYFINCLSGIRRIQLEIRHRKCKYLRRMHECPAFNKVSATLKTVMNMGQLNKVPSGMKLKWINSSQHAFSDHDFELITSMTCI
jgi:hypothetical protein